jgi:hypothetical protein
MSEDHAAIFNSLRASTIILLGYDGIEHLTAAQEIRISRAITLRLTINDLQARQLRGERIDVSAFVEASESLERMAGGVPEKDQSRFGPSHREKLQQLIENALRGSAADHEAEADRAQWDETAALAAAALPDKSTSCASGRAQDGVAPPSPAPAVPAGATPTRPLTDVEKMAKANAEPCNPAPGPREPWRDYVGPDGIIAPYFRG